MSLARERARSLVLGTIGIAGFLGLWELVGSQQWAGMTWPPLSSVLAYILDVDHRGVLWRATAATLSMTALGYLVGVAAGCSAGVVAHAVHGLRPGIDRLAGFVHAVPSIALAPLFVVLLSREYTGTAIAAIGVFFIVYVAVTSGLANSSASHRDLFRVFGASGWRRLLLLDLPAAMPVIVTGLKQSIPVAFIGAILGEWFGASRGLGLLIVSAMQNFQIPLLWSAALIASTASLLAFGCMTLVERKVLERVQ